MARSWSLLLLACLSTGAGAEIQTVPTLTPAERAERRFPQPVRVGDLIGRQVLQPTPAQQVLGRVAAIGRTETGAIEVVVRFGGLFGYGTRPIAVPVEAVALLGEHVVVMDFTPKQLEDFPTVTEPSGRTIAPDEKIRVGLTKPFH